MCVAFRPDGNQVCSGTIRGLLRFWNVDDGSLVCEIDGQKDIKGGMSQCIAFAIREITSYSIVLLLNRPKDE